MFSYCENNPVMGVDQNGEFWHIVAGAIIGAVVNAGTKMISNMAVGAPLTDGLGEAVITGAISGAVATTGLGRFGQAVVGAATNAASYLLSCDAGAKKFDIKELAVTTGIGFGMGLIGGKGLQYEAPKVTSQLKIINSNLHAFRTNPRARNTVITCFSRIKNKVDESAFKYFISSAVGNQTSSICSARNSR